MVQRQAEPFLVGDLATISEYIHARIRECPSSEPSEIYILARDQAVFKPLFFFFAADRAADLSGLKAVDTWCFPDNSGFLIIHIWTKSLKSMDANVFAFENDGVKTQLYALLKVWKCICILVGSSE